MKVRNKHARVSGSLLCQKAEELVEKNELQGDRKMVPPVEKNNLLNEK